MIMARRHSLKAPHSLSVDINDFQTSSKQFNVVRKYACRLELGAMASDGSLWHLRKEGLRFHSNHLENGVRMQKSDRMQASELLVGFSSDSIGPRHLTMEALYFRAVDPPKF